jgi:hypothetical protein
VAVAAIFHESRLQRRFNPSDLGQIDIAAQRSARGTFKVEFFYAAVAQHHNPSFLGVGGIDKHLVGFVVHRTVSDVARKAPRVVALDRQIVDGSRKTRRIVAPRWV